MQRWDIENRPNLIPWPPMLLLGAILLGFGLDALIPISLGSGSIMRALGVLLVVCALSLDIWASLTFRRAQTTILPHQASAALVTDGPFAYSRNPIYLGNLLILFGVGLFFSSTWHIVLILPLALAIFHLAIRREEAHLASRFSEAWTDYSKTVRRWL